MRLLGKQLLMVVADGVDEAEMLMIKEALESEQATVLTTAPKEYLTVETVRAGKRGKDVEIDLPFEAVGELSFDALIIPDGLLAADGLCKEPKVLELVSLFHTRGLPIFASGEAVQLLYESNVLSSHVVVREGTPLPVFLDRAVSILLDQAAPYRLYRPTT